MFCKKKKKMHICFKEGAAIYFLNITYCGLKQIRRASGAGAYHVNKTAQKKNLVCKKIGKVDLEIEPVSTETVELSPSSKQAREDILRRVETAGLRIPAHHSSKFGADRLDN